jgi:protein O-GlcNAc transferase
MTDSPTPSPATADAPDRWREVRFRHSPSFVDVLREARCSLLVSTYQAGKLLAIGLADGKLHFSFHNFDQAMGVAVSPRQLAVGAKGQIWFLQNNAQLAPSIEPAGKYDACYLARTAHVTGGIHCHEMAWGGPQEDELWVVNTLFSCLSTLHDDFSFVPRWRPPFITNLAGEDRCHLNGLAMDQGRPRFVSMMSQTDTAAGWRPTKSTSGVVMDVASGQPVTHGLAMPHSPRWYGGRLWVLNSGFGTLEVVDPASGRRDAVAGMPGYTRGLGFSGPFAFVGLSRIRETAVFGGVPIAEHRHELKCGVGVVDLRTGKPVASLEFETGVEEIFDVQVLSNVVCTALCGPRPDQDGAQDIWLVPRPDQVEMLAASLTVAGRRGGLPALAAGEAHSFGGGVLSLDKAAFRTLLDQALRLQRERRIGEAIELFQRATAARPRSAEAWNHLGNALQDAGQQEQALECYRQAAEAEPTYGPALQNLGYVLVAQGRVDEGRARLEEAQRVQPAPVNHVLIATALPVIYDSVADVQQRRERLLDGVQRIVDDGITIDTESTLVPTNFFAAYQGENDRDLHANLGRIYRGVDRAAGRQVDKSRKRPRVGFISAYFRDHTIGRLNIGRLEKLDREKFEVVVLSVGRHQDPLAERFRRAADKYVEVPRDVAIARQLAADQQLDLLFFADVGMDALTYTLAFSRMAPVQAVTWGHPVTTGSPTIDYFLSGKHLEGPTGDSHYTERLVRVPNLATYYYRPALTAAKKSRSDLGLSPDANVYICPQTLFKFHPAFDEQLGEILRRDPRGELALIEGRTANWTRLLRERFARSMPDVVDRIKFLPALPNDDFLKLLAMADVMLDPPQFGGGNTSYEAFATGTPIVTWPGELMRSRITHALYAKMGIESLTVDSGEAYVARAVELGTDADQRRAIRNEILAKCGILYEDDAEVRDFEHFLLTAVGR